MTSNTDTVSFGKHLRDIRVEKGLSLEDIADETKISMNVLGHIEQEILDQLPSQTVTKGFLRSYAKALNTDGEIVVQGYVSSYRGKQKAIESSERLRGADAKKSQRLIFLVSLICITVLSFYALSTKEKRAEPVPALPAAAETLKTSAETAPALETRTAQETQRVIPEQQQLSISAVEETWLKVIIDEKPPKEYTLAPGDRLELVASSNFNILIGNAGGVRMTVNDEPVRIEGKSGQAITIQIP